MRYSLVLLWTCTAVLVVLCFANETVVLPLKRRDGGLLARGLLRNATLPLHGAVKDYGYFYATLTLGTPAQAFAVIVDTGSTITYVPCASCGSNCGSHHKGVAFDPAASESSEKVTCGTPECQCGRPACGCSAEQECTYSRTYAEQSSSAGLLIRDHLQMYDGAVDIIFGCETKETGEIFNQEADGILGLGNSEVSLVNQLVSGGMIDDVFSLCFGNVEGDGALMLGDVDMAPYNVALQYTSLLSSQAHPHYYLVKLEGISAGGEMLDIPDERFDEGYGTVLDSGTTFTYLPSEVFQQFRDKVNAFALSKGLHVTKGPDPKFHDICYGGAPPVDQRERLDTVFPSMEFHFAEATTLKVGPLNYLFMHTGEAGAYCLGVFDNGGSGTLLGGITFRDVLVQYDRRNQRAGFGQAQCQHIGLTYHCHERDEVGERSSVSPQSGCISSSTSRPGTEAAEIMKGFRRRPWWLTQFLVLSLSVVLVVITLQLTRSHWLPLVLPCLPARFGRTAVPPLATKSSVTLDTELASSSGGIGKAFAAAKPGTTAKRAVTPESRSSGAKQAGSDDDLEAQPLTQGHQWSRRSQVQQRALGSPSNDDSKLDSDR